MEGARGSAGESDMANCALTMHCGPGLAWGQQTEQKATDPHAKLQCTAGLPVTDSPLNLSSHCAGALRKKP